MKTHTADDGAAEVIGFILIIALVVAVAAIWVLVYIPVQGNAVETNHARLVTEEIADIKYGIDLLWTSDRTGTNVSRIISPSPVAGTELSGLLFLSPPVGTGTISVSNGTSFWVNNSTQKNSSRLDKVRSVIHKSFPLVWFSSKDLQKRLSRFLF